MAARAHPIDQCPDILVDRHVCASRELRVRRQPRRKRSVRQDELALRQLLSQRLRERRHPRFSRPVALVHRSQVLVVHVNPVQAVVQNELCHRVRRPDWVRTRRRRLVRLAECGRDDVDAGRGVCGLCGCLLVCGEGGVCLDLVCGAVEGEEGEVDDVEALRVKL